MASGWYNNGKAKIVDGTIDLINDTIKIMLVGTGFSFDADHDFVSSIVANEISNTGYTGGFAGAGRKTLASKALAIDDTNDRAEFTSAAITWTTLGAGVVAGAVLIKEVTDDAASLLIAFIDFTNVDPGGGDLVLTPDAEGILQF